MTSKRGSAGDVNCCIFCKSWSTRGKRLVDRLVASKRIADNALVAMTLLIAESRPAEKSVLVSVIVNLINKRNP